jgi:hypothetical protein
MKTLSFLTLLLAACAIAHADGNGNSATVSPGVSITVVAPIHVTRLADLSFGSYVIDRSSFSMGLVTVGCDDVLNTSSLGRGTWKFTGTGHQTEHAANFAVTGEDGYEFSFTAVEFELLHASGHKFSVAPLLSTVLTHVHGNIPTNVKVGGVLTFLDDARPGVYTGTMHVTAEYI